MKTEESKLVPHYMKLPILPGLLFHHILLILLMKNRQVKQHDEK